MINSEDFSSAHFDNFVKYSSDFDLVLLGSLAVLPTFTGSLTTWQCQQAGNEAKEIAVQNISSNF